MSETYKLSYTASEIDARLGRIDDINNILEDVEAVNILPPDYQMGYWDTSSKVIANSTKHSTTAELVPVIGGRTLYLTWNEATDVITNKLVCIIYFDANGTHIDNTSAYFGSDRDSEKQKYFNLPTNCTHIHFWNSNFNYGLRLADLCLSYSETNTYVPYEEPGKKAIKTSALNESALNILSPLYGKTIVNFGDSIFGKRRPPNDISTELAKLTGATVHNCGFGGCQMQLHYNEAYGAFSMCSLADAIANGDWSAQDNAVANISTNGIPNYFSETLTLLKNLDFSKVDVATIAYGTNDFTSGDGLDNEDAKTTPNTFGGALRYSVEKLLTTYPHLKIYICSQTYRFWNDGETFTEDSDTYTIFGRKLTDYVEKTKEIAKEYHLPYIDLYYSLGFNKFNRTQYFLPIDGTHPIAVGCHLIAAHMAKELF